MDVLINVVNQKLKLGTNINSLVDGTQLWIRFVFNLGDDWDGLTTFAQFGQDGVAYNVYLDSDDSVFLPSEIKPGECTLMLYATGSRKKATTNYLTLTIDENIYVANARSTEITESLYEQLVDMVSGTTTDITALQTQVAINTDAIAGKADMSDLNHIEEIVENLENDEFVAQKIQDAVADEIERYIEGGQIGELVIEDGTLERVKVDTDFERTLVKADTAMQPSVYDPNGIEEDIYAYARQMDDTLTLETLPAQAKAVGDRLTLDSKQLENQNKYTNDSTFKYVNLRWERGQINPSTGEDNQYKARCRTGFISTKDIDAIEICRTSDDYYFGFMYYLYDENKEWLDNSVEDNLHIGSEPGRQVYSGRSFQKHDLLAVPKHVPYIRIVAYAADWTYTELNEFDSNIIAESIRGVITNPDKEVFRDDEMSYHIPITCGRGNLYHDAPDIAVEDLTYAVYRIRTPFIPTSLVDSIVINRTTFNYFVTIFYYNSVDRDPVTHQYVHAYYNDSVDVAGLPIDKTYPYFRIRVRSGNEDSDTDVSVFTPWQVMQDFQFIREKEEPNFEIKTETNGRELDNGYFEKYYPLVYRRQDGEGAFRPFSDVYTIGMSRMSTDGDSGESVDGLIPIDDIDYILNDNGWHVYVRVYDSEKQFLQLYDSTSARISSTVWTITNEEDEVISAYLSIGAWPTNATGAGTVLRKQDWYRNIHLCKNIESNEDLIMLSDVNANRCNGRNYSYVGLSWEQGGISGANVLTDNKARLRTGFLDTREINAVEIEKSATTAYAIYVFRYDENKQPMGFSSLYISYFPTNLDEVDIVALPQGIPYVRLVIRGYTRENDTYVNMATLTLRDVLGNVRGLKALNSETLDEKTNRINVGCMFGRGNLYRGSIDGNYGTGMIENYIYPGTKNRIMTPFIETDKVDVVYFDNTNCNYTVQLYYYDDIGMYEAEYYTTFTSDGESYTLQELAYPIYKTHKYFRLKLMNAAGDGEGSLSPYTCMEDVKFYRHIHAPSPSVATDNEQRASVRHMYELYPKYNYRRTNTSTGQPQPDSNVYYSVDGGCVRVGSDLILADSVDLIVNDSVGTEAAYSVYIHKYGENLEYNGNTHFTATAEIPSARWSGNKYIRVGFTPVDDESAPPYLDVQDVYSKLHFYRGFKSEDTSSNILDLNPKGEMLPKIQQMAGSFSGNSSIGPYDDCVIKLLHFSDLHATNQSATMLQRIIQFNNEYSDYIDTVIHTGDVVNNESNANALATTTGAEKFLNVIGNHDTWDNPAEDEEDSRERWHWRGESWSYEKYIEPFAEEYASDEDLHTVTDKCYYYKDYKATVKRSTQQDRQTVIVEEEKTVLRLIVLDCMHMIDADVDGTCTQPAWFEDVLADTIDVQTQQNRTLPVVIACHVRMVNGNNMSYLDSGFDNPSVNRGGSNSTFPYFIDSSYLPYVTHFVEAGGVIACWLAGHVHADILGTWHCTTGNNRDCDILNICVTTAGDIGRHRTRDVRTAGTRSYDAFNLIGIDTAHGLVKVVRVGMNVNCVMRKIDSFCWDYVNSQLISTS